MGSINPSYSNYYCWLVMNLQWKRVSSGLPSRLQEVLEISWNRHTKHPRPPLNLSIWILLALLHRGKGLSWNLHKRWQYGFWAAQLRNHSSPINFVLHWLNYDLHRVMSTRAWTVICKCHRFKHVFVSVRFDLSIFRSEIYSSSIVLCNLAKIKI